MGTLASMITRLQDETLRPSLTSVATTAINTAVDHYQNERFFFNEVTQKFVTVADQEVYATSDTSLSDLIILDDLKITVNGSEYTLTPRTHQYIRDIQTNQSYTGYPYEFSYYKQSFYLYPIPNASYTCEVSFVRKDYSLTAANVWMVSGFELIRARARAILEIDYFGNKEAEQQAMLLAGQGQDCLSVMEKAILSRMRRETAQHLTTGKLRGSGI